MAQAAHGLGLGWANNMQLCVQPVNAPLPSHPHLTPPGGCTPGVVQLPELTTALSCPCSCAAHAQHALAECVMQELEGYVWATMARKAFGRQCTVTYNGKRC